MHDVCVVGAGPAGLSAALVLGRCGRDVIVYDSGQPRNAASRGLHGYLTRDGIHPRELTRLGREDLAKYPSVQLIAGEVASAQRGENHFSLCTTDGRAFRARILLLATGRIDVLPDKPGFREFYGRGVYHCPYCDGWEHRGQRFVAHAHTSTLTTYALSLRTWSRDILACAADDATLGPDDIHRLEKNGISVARSPLARVHGARDGLVSAVELANGERIERDAVFFTSLLPQKSPLPQSLGCQLDHEGSVICHAHAATGVPGLYVAGNVRGGVHLAIMAAAEGAEAAIAINDALTDAAVQ